MILHWMFWIPRMQDISKHHCFLVFRSWIFTPNELQLMRLELSPGNDERATWKLFVIFFHKVSHWTEWVMVSIANVLNYRRVSHQYPMKSPCLMVNSQFVTVNSLCLLEGSTPETNCWPIPSPSPCNLHKCERMLSNFLTGHFTSRSGMCCKSSNQKVYNWNYYMLL